jgi:hypothetical protein
MGSSGTMLVVGFDEKKSKSRSSSVVDGSVDASGSSVVCLSLALGGAVSSSLAPVVASTPFSSPSRSSEPGVSVAGWSFNQYKGSSSCSSSSSKYPRRFNSDARFTS